MKVIRFLCVLILFMISFQVTYSQGLKNKKKHHAWELRTGVGLLPTFLKDHSKSNLPPLFIEARYRPSATLSLGLLAGHSKSKSTLSHLNVPAQEVSHDYRLLGVRAGIHSKRWVQWEPYGGITLAYQQSRISVEEDDSSKYPEIQVPARKNSFFYSAFIGTSFQPLPHLEIFGELSYGLSLLKLGIGYRW